MDADTLKRVDELGARRRENSQPSGDESRPWGAELQPGGKEPRPLSTLQRIATVVVVMLVAALAGVAYVETATETYVAETDVLITPVPTASETFAGLGLISETGETRPVQTAARLAESVSVARRAAASLQLQETAAQLLEDTEVIPVAESDVIAVTVSAASARDAKARADAFASAFVSERDEQLSQAISDGIADIQAQDELTPALRRQISQLRVLARRGDPTVKIETPAALPRAPDSPKPLVTVVLVSVVAGMLVGLVLLFVLQAYRTGRR